MAAVLGSVLFGYLKSLGPAPSTSRDQGVPQFRIAGSDGYVDPAQCAGCHRQIWETYKRTGMGKSFSKLDVKTVVEGFSKNNNYYHAESDRHYTMYQKENRFYQRRYQIGFDGQETNVVEKQIDFVMGSGNHSRTYLHKQTDGRIVELPVGWYAEKGGYWAMNPGYDRADQEDFRRRITFQCVFCHNGYPEIAEGADASGTESIFPGSLPEGIDCQRCHGPGRAHVEAMQSGKHEKAPGGIVNPARLSQERQLELCMQCHLETTSFRLPHAVTRFTRGIFSYRPGEPLADYVLHFDQAAGTGHDDKFEIAHAAYRLRLSACFNKSGGAMVCTTCHDPHDIPRGEAATQHYRSVCVRCHSAALQKIVSSGRHTPSPDCLGCHMPKRRTDDVVHVVMTDHFIQRQKPSRDLLASHAERVETDQNAYKGEVMLYYPPAMADRIQQELYLAMAQVRQGSNLKTGIPRLEAAIEKYRPPEGEFYFELAEAYNKVGLADKAIAMYRQTLLRKPDFRPAVQQLAATLGRTGHLSEAAETLQKALTAGPQDASMLNDLGLIDAGLGRRDEAVRKLQEALRLDPDLPDSYNNLGAVLAESGNHAAAEAAYRAAVRSQPDLAEARKNLANELSATNHFEEAQFHYRKAIQSHPELAALYHDYGLALAGHESFREAAKEFETAIRVEPGRADSLNALGEMRAILGDTNGAIDSYRRAVAVRPQLAAAQANLGAALLVRGSTPEAKQHLEEAVRLQPELFEAHLHLGRALALERDVAGASAHYRKATQSTDPAVRDAAHESLLKLEQRYGR